MLSSLGGLPGTRHQESTVYVGNIDSRVDEELLWELMMQTGPVRNVQIPRDMITGSVQGFAFVEFKNEEDAKYACIIMNNVKVYERVLKVNPAQNDAGVAGDDGASVYIVGLDPVVDERTLSGTFQSFGTLLAPPKIFRDQDGNSKGTAMLRYDTIDSAQRAITAMNQQIFFNRTITVTFASRKGTIQTGEQS